MKVMHWLTIKLTIKRIVGNKQLHENKDIFYLHKEKMYIKGYYLILS